MAKIDRAASEFKAMDELAALRSPVHEQHPLAKLIVTVAYILTTVSFPKYELTGLIAMALWPALLFALSGIPVSTCFYKLRVVLPLVCAVGLLNPLFDRTTVIYIGTAAVSGGVVSMLTLMLKGVFCLSASFLLAATTSMDALCAALRTLHMPGFMVTLLLLTYRYIAVMLEEVGVMTDAYRLRAPGQRGLRFDAWGSFLGQLFLRSADRAEEIYACMCLRGFDGTFRYAEARRFTFGDGGFVLAALAAFFLLRSFDLPRLLGGLFV